MVHCPTYRITYGTCNWITTPWQTMHMQPFKTQGERNQVALKWSLQGLLPLLLFGDSSQSRLWFSLWRQYFDKHVVGSERMREMEMNTLVDTDRQREGRIYAKLAPIQLLSNRTPYYASRLNSYSSISPFILPSRLAVLHHRMLMGIQIKVHPSLYIGKPSSVLLNWLN